MKNIIQSIYKIANTGFGYKRLQKDVQGAKILCLTLDPIIPASVTFHVSLFIVFAILVDQIFPYFGLISISIRGSKSRLFLPFSTWVSIANMNSSSSFRRFRRCLKKIFKISLRTVLLYVALDFFYPLCNAEYSARWMALEAWTWHTAALWTCRSHRYHQSLLIVSIKVRHKISFSISKLFRWWKHAYQFLTFSSVQCEQRGALLE